MATALSIALRNFSSSIRAADRAAFVRLVSTPWSESIGTRDLEDRAFLPLRPTPFSAAPFDLARVPLAAPGRRRSADHRRRRLEPHRLVRIPETVAQNLQGVVERLLELLENHAGERAGPNSLPQILRRHAELPRRPSHIAVLLDELGLDGGGIEAGDATRASRLSASAPSPKAISTEVEAGEITPIARKREALDEVGRSSINNLAMAGDDSTLNLVGERRRRRPSAVTALST